MARQYLVRFGRSDNSAIKTIQVSGKRNAFHLANSLSFVFWFRHDFKQGQGESIQRVEQDGFWVEIFPDDND